MILIAMRQNDGIQTVDSPLLQQRQQRFGPDFKRIAADAPFLPLSKADRSAAVDQNMGSFRCSDQDAVALAYIQITDRASPVQILRKIAFV
ncbi:hypothetical protein D3C75_1278930 [compost metagenome]